MELVILEGGRGAMSGATGKERGLSFGGAGADNTKGLLPSRINRLGKTGDVNRMFDHLRDSHGAAKHEYGATITDSGYATSYRNGNDGSVSFETGKTKDTHIWHNHPERGWGNFSGADLMSFATGQSRSMTAESVKPKSTPSGINPYTYRNRMAGRYTIKKTGHFKPQEFAKGLKGVKVKDSNYDKGLDKWLKNNAKKYGYEYSYTKK